jgi:YegS/Rv2252/BmrU family lipid kinase
MSHSNTSTLLFVINPGAGNRNTNFRAEIEKYFHSLPYQIHFFELEKNTQPGIIKQKIAGLKPRAVVAVGGDGTVKLVAECLLGTNVTLGIVPAGSANGTAKDLGIPIKTNGALDIICKNATQSIHAIKINDQLSIHLSDIGINAWLVKKFTNENNRGWWGYLKAGWKVIWRPQLMQVEIRAGDKQIQRQAFMVVIANATKYGTGVVINPSGDVTDDIFEIVIVKKISLKEIFKMKINGDKYDPKKTEVFQTRSVKINSRHSAHFQVDGEYIGKTTSVIAEIIPRALTVLMPHDV